MTDSNDFLTIYRHCANLLNIDLLFFLGGGGGGGWGWHFLGYMQVLSHSWMPLSHFALVVLCPQQKCKACTSPEGDICFSL